MRGRLMNNGPGGVSVASVTAQTVRCAEENGEDGTMGGRGGVSLC